MKTLHATVTTEKNKANAAPYLVIEIQFAGAIGTKYYSEQVLTSPATENDLLLNASALQTQINEQSGEVTSVSVEISDVSKTILGYLRAEEIFKRPIKIYQCFVGVLWANQTLIFHGTIKTATRRESSESVTFTGESYQTNFEDKIGSNTTVSTAKKEGEILPIVVGKVSRSKCVQTIESKRTTLVVPLKITGTSGVVSDGKEFSQGTYQDFWIGQELVRGKFDGCKITLIQRGKVIQSGTTIGMQPNELTFRANLSPQGYSWVGSTVRFFVTPTKSFTRTISNFTSPDVYGMKSIAIVPGGTYYEIFTPASNHDVGEEVYERKTEYKWVINDAVSNKVDFVEIKSSISMEGENTSSKLREIETFVRLDERYTTINLNDGGQTTVTLPFDPRHLRNSPYKDTDLYATLTGVNYSNPVDIIVYLAQKFGLSYPGDFDTASITSEKAKVNWLVMGLVIKERLVFESLFDIAFQARLSLKFVNNKLTFEYLQNKAQTSVKTITNADRELDSLEITQTEVEANKLEVVFAPSKDEDEKRFEVKDATSISIYGEKAKTLNLWAIQDEVYARAIANFWLRRWSYPNEKAKITTFLNAFELELNDWVTLDLAGSYSSQPAEVIEISQTPSGDAIDKIEYEVRLPRWAGCASSCEQYEETGCASSCEQYCTSSAQTGCNYACETSDQTACALTCVTMCELECTTACQMKGNQTGCGSSCTAGCQSTCQTTTQTSDPDDVCESGCEVGCEVGCETGNESCSDSCQAACQVACESTGCQSMGCESACTAACQSSCETDCQGACQSGCTTGCTGGCQTGAETCALSCQACCEGACQSTCEQVCESTCQNTCTADIQLISQTNCTKACEASCQGACEGKCQDCCQVDGTETSYTCITACQVGCVNMCQSSMQSGGPGGGSSACATQCEAYCMTTAAQVGCALYCTVGCMCDCEATCEGGACRTGCEIDCECTCQNAAQPAACSLGTEGACFASCQATIQGQCLTGCEAACQAFCMLQGCESSCEIYCTVGCMCDCEATCEGGACQTGCEVSCECTCQTAAQTQNTCAQYYQAGDTCFSSCRDYCQTGNTTTLCASSCRSFAMTGGCATGCELYCTIGCMCGCEQTCQSYCRTGCETKCECFCMTAAAVNYQDDKYSCVTYCRAAVEYISGSETHLYFCLTCCQAICTTACTAYCQTGATTGQCLTSCRSFAMTGGCATGCELYCTIGCMCSCTQSCQSYCRTGCETGCRCLCQTAAQI